MTLSLSRTVTHLRPVETLLKTSLTTQTAQKVTDSLIWGLPCLVPLVQQRQYPDNYAFSKDIASCVLGSLVFLGTRGGVNKLVLKSPWLKQKLPLAYLSSTGAIVGALITFAYNCFIPPRIGKFLDRSAFSGHNSALANYSLFKSTSKAPNIETLPVILPPPLFSAQIEFKALKNTAFTGKGPPIPTLNTTAKGSLLSANASSV